MPGIDNFTPIALSESVNNIISPKTFVLDKIFSRKRMHRAKIIQVDLRVAGKKLAPFIKRGAAGKVLDKHGVKTQYVEPPHIRVKKHYSPDEVKHIRGVGEPVHVTGGGSVSAGMQYVAEDQKLTKDEIIRRKEWMAIQALKGGFTYTDNVDGIDFAIDFLMPSANKPTLTSTAKWDDTANSKPGSNILEWQKIVGQGCGRGATVGIATREVFDPFLENAQVQKLLDFRRADQGAIDTTKIADEYGVIYRGNIHGVDLFEYNEQYEDDNGDLQSMVGTDQFLLIAPSADFRLNYGITEDMKAGLVSMPYFSKMWEVEDPSGMWMLIESNPLPTPHQPAAVVAATVK